MKIRINQEKVKEAKEFMVLYKKELLIAMSIFWYAIGCNLFYFIGRIGSETEFTPKVIAYFVCLVPLVLLVLGAFGYLIVKAIIGIASLVEIEKEVS